MQLSDFSFEVPPELIAQQPALRRDSGRLMLLDGACSTVGHHQVSDLPDHLRAGDRLVFNNTRVIKARLYGQKKTGGKVELLIERVTGLRQALAKVRASKSPVAGTAIVLADNVELRVEGRQQDLFCVSIQSGPDFEELLKQFGEMPLPPYIERPASEGDDERYQTVYASVDGAVAAPTAGLHFTDELLSRLQAHGVDSSFVTLHVGAGTFQPVRCDNLDEHVMHAERVEINQQTVDQIRQTRERGGRVIAVGTTSMRTLEAASVSGELQPMAAETRLFLRPGAVFNTVDGLLTNFHLSQSTLLMLVCAFAGKELTLQAYRKAVEARYRFFSYGDAMLVWPDRNSWGAGIASPPSK